MCFLSPISGLVPSRLLRLYQSKGSTTFAWPKRSSAAKAEGTRYPRQSRSTSHLPVDNVDVAGRRQLFPSLSAAFIPFALKCRTDATSCATFSGANRLVCVPLSWFAPSSRTWRTHIDLGRTDTSGGGDGSMRPRVYLDILMKVSKARPAVAWSFR